MTQQQEGWMMSVKTAVTTYMHVNAMNQTVCMEMKTKE